MRKVICWSLTFWGSSWSTLVLSFQLNIHRIGLWENLQESPIFDGKNPWVSCRFSLKPIQWNIVPRCFCWNQGSLPAELFALGLNPCTSITGAIVMNHYVWFVELIIIIVIRIHAKHVYIYICIYTYVYIYNYIYI